MKLYMYLVVKTVVIGILYQRNLVYVCLLALRFYMLFIEVHVRLHNVHSPCIWDGNPISNLIDFK